VCIAKTSNGTTSAPRDTNPFMPTSDPCPTGVSLAGSAFLEQLSREATDSLGVSIKTARALVRMAMVDVAISFEVPAHRIAAHLDLLMVSRSEAL
jgi:hypothetical protein